MEINITYDAIGRKMKKTVTQAGNSTTKEYRGSFEFAGANLESYYHEEGRLVPKTGGGYQLEYTLKDHLGNARITFADINVNGSINAASEILQEETYYPFGLQQSGLNTSITGVENKYQYNGKEFNDELGLNMYDYGARWYMADLGRWGVNDPLAEKYLSMSPYNYVANNPIRFIDPDGKEVIDAKGNIVANLVEGAVVYTEYASDDLKNIFNQMGLSTVGSEVVSNMIKSDNKIYVNVDHSEGPTYYDKKTKEKVKEPNENTDLRVGSTSTYIDKETKEVVFIVVDIFVGSIEYAIENKKAAIFEDGSVLDVSNNSVIEVMGGTCVHEGTHATDKNSNSALAPDKSKVEKLPKENEKRYYEDIIKKKSE